MRESEGGIAHIYLAVQQLQQLFSRFGHDDFAPSPSGEHDVLSEQPELFDETFVFLEIIKIIG